MTGFNNKSLLLACMAGLALGGCFGGDSTSDLASPSKTGSNPGTQRGGGGSFDWTYGWRAGAGDLIR